jgi:ComF family protein
MNARPDGGRTVRRGAVVDAILNLVFPPRCVACGTSGSWFCSDCLDLVQFFEPPYPAFLDPMWPLEDVRSAAQLVSPLREAIHALKYQGLRALDAMLGDVLFDCFDADPWAVDVVVPVPLHPSRLRERGYNQSALLARRLGSRAAIRVAERTLLRVTPTRPQVGLSASERAENVRGAFSCANTTLHGLNVLLVDDVLTTGATLRACAEALMEGGAQSVSGLTLARD